MKLQAITILLWFLTFNAAVYAQYNFKSLNTNDGLSDNDVTSILHDAKGFVWFGTSNGLCRYDGYITRSYSIPQNDKPDFPNIKKIEEDLSEQIWITDINNHVYCYNRMLDVVEDNAVSHLQRLGISPSGHQFKIFIGTDRSLWCIAGKRLYNYSFQEKRIRVLSANHAPVCVIGSSKQAFTVSANGSVCRVNFHSGTLNPIGRVSIKGASDISMYVDHHCNIWVYDKYIPGLYKLDGSSVFSTVKKESDEHVTAIMNDHQGNLWIGTNSSGIRGIHPNGQTIFHLTKEENNPFSLSSNHIGCLYQDHENTMWVGTSKAGVAYTNPDNLNIRIISTPFMEDISCFWEDENKHVWIGYDGKGLVRTGGQAAIVRHFDTRNSPLTSNLVIGAHNALDGTTLLSTYGGGIYQFRNNTLTALEWGRHESLLFARSMCRDDKGNLWIGSVKAGLSRISPQGEVRTYTFHNSALNTNAVTDVCRSKTDGRIYCATATGLCYVDTDGKLKTAGAGDHSVNSLSRLSITTMLCDTRGLLWIGTKQGLRIYSRDFKLVSIINGKRGIGQVRALTTDHQGNVWTTTDRGLVMVRISTEQDGRLKFSTTLFSSNDGLGNITFTKYAIFCADNGDILAGGFGKFVRISPNVNPMPPVNKRVCFTELYLGNERISPKTKDADGRVLLEQNLISANALTFRYDDDFSVEVSAFDYLHSSNIRYAYRLSDDTKWVTMEGNRIYLSHLSPGTYRLQVKMAGEGEEATISSIKLTITPPLWLSGEAFCIYILLIAIISFMFRRHIRQRHLQEERMRIQEAQQTKLRELDAAKIKFFTNVSHDLRTPLSLILSPVEQLLSSGKHTDIADTLHLIHRNAKSLLNEIDQLLDIRRLEYHGEHIEQAEGDLTAFLLDTCEPYKTVGEKKQIRIHIEENRPHIYTSFDKEKLKRIVINLLSNALKYNEQNGEVDIRATHAQGLLTIRISDTGIGIQDINKKKIFERFFQEERSEKASHTGSGIGLHIVKEYVDLMQGTISVEDNLPHGTVFTVTLPAPHIAQKDSRSVPYGGEKKRHTLLIVEDNDDFRRFIKESLQEEYTVFEAGNGKEALELTAQESIDMIVSDVMMPVMDGLQLCHRIKTDINFSHIPVILLTARTADEHVISGLKEGADEYITKPFNMEILKIKIRKLFDWMQLAYEKFKQPDMSSKEVSISSLDEKLIEKATSIVERHLAETEFGVEDFSAEMNMSRSALYKKLMAVSGRSPLEFMRIIRLRHGLQILQGEGCSISETAYRVGLSPKQFSKFFKEEYGLLPSQYLTKNL